MTSFQLANCFTFVSRRWETPGCCSILLCVVVMSDSEEELSFASVEDGEEEKISGSLVYD